MVNDSDEEELEACPSCHAEICVSNIITKKRRHAEVIREESDDEGDDPEDSSSDYVPAKSAIRLARAANPLARVNKLCARKEPKSITRL